MSGRKRIEIARILTVHGPPGVQPSEVFERYLMWPRSADTIIIAEYDLLQETSLEEEWLAVVVSDPQGFPPVASRIDARLDASPAR